MVERKGIGYILEVIAAMLVFFAFVLGNVPESPSTDWNQYQRQVLSQDLTVVMERSGDVDDFIRNGETGTINTMAQTLSNDRLEVTGSVENVPISTEVVGFHVLESDRSNISIGDVSTLPDNECYDSDDLEEIEPNDGSIMRSETQTDGTYIYIADTDPDISGGNGDLDYDTLYIDNATRCQFSSAEGPYYTDEIFYWGNSTGQDHFDIKNMYSSDERVELFLASQVARMRPTLKSRVNGIDTGLVIDTVGAERANLDSYDILVFRDREVLDDSTSVLNREEQRFQRFLSSGTILLLADLQKSDFYSGGSIDDNFITSTGLKWVSLGYDASPSSPSGGRFPNSPGSRELRNYFDGKSGDLNNIDLAGGGSVSSSNTQYFKQSDGLLNSGSGRYDTTEWNATNYNMQQVDPDAITGYPETACVENSESTALTRGEFDFRDYEDDQNEPYTLISTQLGKSDTYCNNNYVRAISIDRDDDQDYSEANEGPFLEGDRFTVNGKRYAVTFPSSQAVQTGQGAEMVYIGDSSIESINYRTSFADFDGRALARMPYKQNYNQDERRMIASTLHWLSRDTKQFGTQGRSETTTEIVGGVKEETFIPYRIDLRWKQK